MSKHLSLGQQIKILVERMDYLTKRVDAFYANSGTSITPHSISYNKDEIVALKSAIQIMTNELAKRKGNKSCDENNKCAA